MKSRRLPITAFLLVSVLIMGIGYSLLADTLTVSGGVTITSFDADVTFSNAVAASGSEGAFETLTYRDDGATMDVKADALKEAGNTVSATFTIKNEASYPVLIAADPTIDAVTHFSVTTDWGDKDTVKEIPAGGTIDVTVTILVNITPTANDIAGSVDVKLKAIGKIDDSVVFSW